MSISEKLKAGKYVLLGEFEPPKGPDFSGLLGNANHVKGRLDALVIPEMANAVVKASSLGGCAFLARHGFNPVFQASCRDRNRLALQADLLAASALGVSDMMAVNGEDIRFGDQPQARSVYDVDLMQLIETMAGLRKGKDMAGIELNSTPSFSIGATINAGAMGGALDIELENLEKMIDRGVEFVITTPVFDMHRFNQFARRIAGMSIAVIPTVLLLKSAGMARYIDRNIKNISIPSDLIRDIQKSPDKLKQCVKIAADLIVKFKETGMSGVMISTMGWEDRLPLILDEARL